MTLFRSRTRIALAVSLLWGGPYASAQRWEIGATAGVSHGALNGGQEFAWNAAAPTTSLFMRRSLTSRVSVQPEVSVLRRGGVSTLPGSTLTLNADYLELPLMLLLHAGGGSDAVVRPYLSAGPSVAIRLRCAMVFQGGGLVSRNACDGTPGAGGVTGTASNRVDMGIAGGAGIDWRFGATSFSIDARATTGLRANVLPIDAQARSYGWKVSAGLSTSLHRTAATVSGRASRMTDANIAAMVLAFANTEISYDGLVPPRSARADVREFAQQMLVEHRRVKSRVFELLAKLDVGAEDNRASLGMRDESVVQRDPMYLMEGAAFDSAYVNGEVRLQRELLSSIDAVMLPSAPSPEMRQLLTNLRPEVEAHLARAERLRAAVMPPRPARPAETP